MTAGTKFTINVIYLLIICIFIAVFIQTINLKIFSSAKYVQQVNSRKLHTISARRGDILAKDGRILACSVPNYKIVMDPSSNGLSDEVFNAEIDDLARSLSDFFRDKSASQYKELISSARHNKRHSLVINPRRISYAEMKIVKEFPIFKHGRNKGGFTPEETGMRKMPFGMLAARTVGRMYSDKEKGGYVGIELAYEKELRGIDGQSQSLRIGRQWVPNEISAPVNGKDIVSTIDIDIQDVAENSLKQQLERYAADHGVAILMEVKTGAIRAIVNLQRQSDGNYNENCLNFAIGEAMEPGSTFKLATVMACLEDGVISVDDTINTFAGEFRFFDRTMRDSKKGGHGMIKVDEAFEVSSNIAFSRIVDKCYRKDPQRFINRLRSLGICDSLGIELPGEARTFLKNYNEDGWSRTSLPWMSIGYEMTISPLHILTLYNAVANGGTMMRPMFVEGISENGEIVERKRPKVLRNSIASRKTIETVRRMLEGVVEKGTAINIKNTKGYSIAGKTGTAQIANKGQYSNQGEKKYLASFAGYFPADKPVYSCIVSVTGPNNVYYGNIVAGSVVKAIADRVYASEFKKGEMRQKSSREYADVFPYSKGGRMNDLFTVFRTLNIQYNDNVSRHAWVSTQAKETSIAVSTKPIVDGMMPDVRGMGAKDAVSLLESRGLRVRLRGYGKVATQSIPHGTKYERGTTVDIELRI